MGFFDIMAEFSVTTVLVGNGISKMSSFTFESHNFAPSLLPRVAYEIQQGKIGVKYSSTIGTIAIYNSTENNFYVGFLSADSESRKALVVHEACHALYDYQSATMDVATSESIAYIAQCLYARTNTTSTNPNARLFSDDPAKDKVFEVGWRIAGKIIGGSAIDSTDCADMRNAVKGHPYYASEASDSAGFNGI